MENLLYNAWVILKEVFYYPLHISVLAADGRGRYLVIERIRRWRTADEGQTEEHEWTEMEEPEQIPVDGDDSRPLWL